MAISCKGQYAPSSRHLRSLLSEWVTGGGGVIRARSCGRLWCRSCRVCVCACVACSFSLTQVWGGCAGGAVPLGAVPTLSWWCGEVILGGIYISSSSWSYVVNSGWSGWTQVGLVSWHQRGVVLFVHLWRNGCGCSLLWWGQLVPSVFIIWLCIFCWERDT